MNESKIKVQQQDNISTTAIIDRSEIYGNVKIGDFCKIHKTTIKGGTIEIDSFSTLWGPNIDLYAKINEIKIGKFCSIARNVSFQEYNHNWKRISSYFISKNIFNKNIKHDICSKGGIVIGNDVWIGAHSVILSGVNIGDGVIVAANSVVTDNIPPYSIVGGSPAKVIKYRFDKALVDKLVELKWWDWPLDRIKVNQWLFEKELQLSDFEKIS